MTSLWWWCGVVMCDGVMWLLDYSSVASNRDAVRGGTYSHQPVGGLAGPAKVPSLDWILLDREKGTVPG